MTWRCLIMTRTQKQKLLVSQIIKCKYESKYFAQQDLCFNTKLVLGRISWIMDQTTMYVSVYRKHLLRFVRKCFDVSFFSCWRCQKRIQWCRNCFPRNGKRNQVRQFILSAILNHFEILMEEMLLIVWFACFFQWPWKIAEPKSRSRGRVFPPSRTVFWVHGQRVSKYNSK